MLSPTIVELESRKVYLGERRKNGDPIRMPLSSHSGNCFCGEGLIKIWLNSLVSFVSEGGEKKRRQPSIGDKGNPIC